MKHPSSLRVVLLLLCVCAPGSASAQFGISSTQFGKGGGRKSGILSRAAIGMSYANASEGSGNERFSIGGPGLCGALATGLFLFKNFALHAEMYGDILLDPSVELGDEQATAKGSFSAFGFGMGPTYYLMPINIYLSQTLGAGAAELSTGMGSGGTEIGFAAHTLVGKEWFVGEDWGLGVAARFALMVLPDEQRLTVLGGGLLASVSFNPSGRPRQRGETTGAVESAAIEPATGKKEPEAAASERRPEQEPATNAREGEGDGKEEAPVGEAALETPLRPGPPLRTFHGRGWAMDVPTDWVEQPVSGAMLAHLREPQLRAASFTTVTVEAELFMGDAAAYRKKLVEERGQSLLSQRPVTVGGLAGLEMEVDLGGKPPRRSLQRAATDGGAGYVLTCTADGTMYEEAKAVCERIFDSFRFEHAVDLRRR
jgi:hypothetical protein